MNLDLANFRKVEMGNKHTILEHPSGHRIKIAHQGLSNESRKQLEEMPTNLAKGGAVGMKGAKPSKPSKSTNTMPGSPTAAKSFTEPQEMGTSIPKAELQAEMTNGQQPDVVLSSLNRTAPPFGPLSSEPKQHYPPCINPSCKSYGKSHPNCLCYGGNSMHSGAGEAGHFAEGGEVEKEYYCDNNRPHFKKCEYYKDGGNVQMFAEKGEVEPDQPTSAPMELSAQDVDPNADVGSSMEKAPVSPNPELTPKPAPNEQQPQPSQFPKNPVSEEDKNFDQKYESPGRDPYLDYAQNITNNMLTHAQNFQDDLNSGAIKPQHYFHLFSGNKDEEGKPTTLGKIGSVFGLMLSGIGSGLTGQPNAALQIMNNEINNDIRSQESSATNKQNLLRINQQGLMNQAQMSKINMDVATGAKLLSISNQRRAAMHHLVASTQNMPEATPQQQQQKQAAYQTLGLMNQQIQAEDNDAFTKYGAAQAQRYMIYGNQSGNAPNTMAMKTGMFGEPIAKMGEDIEQKTVDNVPSVAGQKASRPIPQDKRDQVNNMNVLENKANDLMSYAKQHEGSWNPQTRAIAQQKANEMVGFYGSSLGTSMTQGNRTWLDEQIAQKNPTSVIAQQLYGSNSKLQEIANSNNMRRDQLLKGLGFNPKQSKNNNDQGQTKTVNGVTYKRGPNGEAVPVK